MVKKGKSSINLLFSCLLFNCPWLYDRFSAYSYSLTLGFMFHLGKYRVNHLFFTLLVDFISGLIISIICLFLLVDFISGLIISIICLFLLWLFFCRTCICWLGIKFRADKNSSFCSLWFLYTCASRRVPSNWTLNLSYLSCTS